MTSQRYLILFGWLTTSKLHAAQSYNENQKAFRVFTDLINLLVVSHFLCTSVESVVA